MTRQAKVILIKKLVKAGYYNWKKAVEDAADRIIQNPESLLWR